MSRAQQGAVDKTAANQNTTYNTNAQSGDTAAQGDIGSYANAVGAFKAANPYGQGGPVQTAQNQQVSDTAAGAAQAAGNAVQSSAVRTGQNAGGAIAATQDMQEQNTRDLMGQEAADTAANAGAGAGYAGQVVADTGQTAGMQGKLAAQESGAAQGALNTQEQAAQTPSFMDELGKSVAGMPSSFAQGAGMAAGGGCWIAAELYGGWEDPRTLLVRSWIFGAFRQSWYGELLCRAYLRWGEGLAEAIKVRRRLRAGFQWLFDRALKAAGKSEVIDGGR